MARNSGFEKTIFNGWHNAYEAANRWLRVVAVPRLGGRIMYFGPANDNLLWINDKLIGEYPKSLSVDAGFADWQNFGGDKAWPAPQGWETAEQWPGPPDPILDAGEYIAQISPEGNLIMESPYDPRTDLVIRRSIKMDSSSAGLVVKSTYVNRGKKLRKWAPWHNTQLACPVAGHHHNGGHRLYLPVNVNSQFENGYHVIFGDEDNPQWRRISESLLEVDYQERVGKIGLDASAGWLAYHRQADDIVFCQRFKPEMCKIDCYPDGGSTVACWTMGRGVAAGFDWGQLKERFMEAEVMGPITPLEPGEETSLLVRWNITRCPAPITWAGKWGCANEFPIIRRVSPDCIEVKGRFGVFNEGDLKVEVLRQREWHCIWSRRVEPLVSIEIAELIHVSLPDDVFRLSLDDMIIASEK